VADDPSAVEAVIDEFYRLISGSAEDVRDRRALRRLFCNGACVLPISRTTPPQALGIDAYIERLRTALSGRSFHERGLGYRVEVRGSITQVWSRYEAADSPDWSRTIKAGTNLVQLVRQGSEWKIFSMLYEDDAPSG
jgi:hypothetical protein